MLLSDVLYIAKNINNKALNEAYSSSILKNVLRSIEQSCYLKGAYRRDNGKLYQWGIPDKFDIKNSYKDLEKNGMLTQECFDDPEEREKILNTVIKECNDGPIIEKFNKALHDYGLNLNLAKMTDNDFTKQWFLTKEEKEARIKKQLMFWFNYDDDFVALSYGRDIIVFNKIKSLSWYKVNYNYTGPTNIDEVMSSDENIYEFINQAYIPVRNYNLHYYSTSNKFRFIKHEGGTLDNLLNNHGVCYAYVLDRKKERNVYDMTDKMKLRKEYKEYLETQVVTAEQIKADYEKRVKVLKLTRNTSDDIAVKLDDMYNDLFDCLQDLQRYELDYLSSIDEKTFSAVIGESLFFDRHVMDYFDEIQKHNKSFEVQKYGVPNRLSLYRADAFRKVYIKNIGDLFSIVNAYIMYVLHLCDVNMERVISINNMTASKNPDCKDQIIREISSLKSSYEDVLLRWVNTLYAFDRWDDMIKVKEKLKNYTNIDLEEIFEPLKKYYDPRKYRL